MPACVIRQGALSSANAAIRAAHAAIAAKAPDARSRVAKAAAKAAKAAAVADDVAADRWARKAAFWGEKAAVLVAAERERIVLATQAKALAKQAAKPKLSVVDHEDRRSVEVVIIKRRSFAMR